MRGRREVVRGGVRRDRVVAWVRRGRDRIEEVGHIIARGRICVGVVGGRAHSSGDAAKTWMRPMVCCESVETIDVGGGGSGGDDDDNDDDERGKEDSSGGEAAPQA